MPSHRAEPAARRWHRPLPLTVCEAEGGPIDDVAAEFSRLVNEADGLDNLLKHRSPTHLLPPTTVVASVLDALQRNDWPDIDAGVRAAFAFTKPLPVDATAPTPATPHARSWAALEAWLDLPEFSNHLHSAPFRPLLEVDSWRFASALTFPSSRTEAKAVQAVTITAGQRSFTFTFCLERAEGGPLKGCWLVVGVRQGDYSV